MKTKFNWDKVDGLAKALGGRVELIGKLLDKDGYTPEMIDLIKNSEFRKDFIHLYGFHIDSNESDPMEAVTYLEDAVGMAPAHMNYASGKFDYGDWENAFFMPRPCMLKYDGTVDYYLDPNDYGKKEDGTASDVADFAYGGNAMMEWGRDGKKIWYKIVPDEDDNTSASIYFSDQKLDDGFHAWSFINNQGNLVDHFYTPIYNGTIDSNGKLRSISDKTNTELCQNKTAAEEIEAAELNNPGEDKLWYTEVFADITLINLLLVLISKCLDTQAAFGDGHSRAESGYMTTTLIGTGTLNDKGLFYGSNDEITSVKVFGMENYWANIARRFAGLVSADTSEEKVSTFKYKFTYGTEDGSEAEQYNTTGETYIDSGINIDLYNITPSYIANNGAIQKYAFIAAGAMFLSGMQDNSTGRKTYYCDWGSVTPGINYPIRGGRAGNSFYCGSFALFLSVKETAAAWEVGASLSCKPLS